MKCSLRATGRIGKLETGVTQQGTAIAKFTLASSYYEKDANGKGEEKTEWTPFVAWGAKAEYITKVASVGDLVEVEADKRTSQKDGKYYTNYKVSYFDRLAKKAKAAETAPAANAAPELDDEEIPF